MTSPPEDAKNPAAATPAAPAVHLPEPGALRNADIRDANVKLVLRLIRARRIASQSQVVGWTGLTAPTVYRIFTSLIDEGLLRDVGPATVPRDRRGRRPSFYEIESAAGYALGVDLSTRDAVVTVIDLAGDAVQRESTLIAGSTDVTDLINRVARACKRALDAIGVDHEQVLGVGVGAPGVVDVGAGVVTACPRYPLLEGVPLAARLGALLGIPVHVHNNTSVIALAEYRYGGASGERSVVAILLRSGVGGAFVQDGRLFMSHDKTALEVGRWIVDMGGGPMRSEVLEEYLSEDAIVARASAIRPDVHDMPTMLRRLDEGDEGIHHVISELAALLSKALSNIALLLKPDVFLVITRSGRLSEVLVEEMERRISPTLAGPGAGFPRMVALRYDPERACRGAADLVFDRVFDGFAAVT